MADKLSQVFKAVKKFAASIERDSLIDAMIKRAQTHDKSQIRDTFHAYVPDCGYQEGQTIPELIANLEAEFKKRKIGGNITEPADDDLPF